MLKCKNLLHSYVYDTHMIICTWHVIDPNYETLIGIQYAAPPRLILLNIIKRPNLCSHKHVIRYVLTKLGPKAFGRFLDNFPTGIRTIKWRDALPGDLDTGDNIEPGKMAPLGFNSHFNYSFN